MAALTVGDPMDPRTDVGPLATAAELEKLAAQVDSAVRDGARLLAGGKPAGGKGFYYPPTVLAGIPPRSPAYRDEIFGPVAMLYRVKDVDEAIAVANDVPFGLGSSVWTNDEAERRRFVDDLEAGATFVNAMVASDPRLPFGGVKRSGYGRELARDGIREFVNVKAVSIMDDQRAKPSATE
jgi:succinate-semialdehyde dehydrogenase/glutarate-semialdehyde dehydrogenase